MDNWEVGGVSFNLARPTKIKFEYDIKFKDIATENYGASLALDEEGNLWAWGNNSNGVFGDGTTESCTKPKKSF